MWRYSHQVVTFCLKIQLHSLQIAIFFFFPLRKIQLYFRTPFTSFFVLLFSWKKPSFILKCASFRVSIINHLLFFLSKEHNFSLVVLILSKSKKLSLKLQAPNKWEHSLATGVVSRVFTLKSGRLPLRGTATADKDGKQIEMRAGQNTTNAGRDLHEGLRLPDKAKWADVFIAGGTAHLAEGHFGMLLGSRGGEAQPWTPPRK